LKVLVLGGDGFCGWPTSLHLSQIGCDVTIVDNLSRRLIDERYSIASLTPIREPDERIGVWEELTGRRIGFVNLSVGESYDQLVELLANTKPDAIIHFAEQRSAPFSMKSPTEKRFTISNNVRATHDLVCAVAECAQSPHVVHLGSMGVYGYKSTGFARPEGYLPILIRTENGLKEDEILCPADPESIYHLTKALDQLIFQYYAKNNGLRITDLHQGIVWGTQTQETALDERLINRFDYDGDFGTVLNRFLVQAALGYPLTVYGSGGQTRAFIHIRDTVRGIELSLRNPASRGQRVNIFNQVTETHRVLDLAKLVSAVSGTPYRLIDNPRFEQAENELEVSNEQFLDLGIQPTRLNDALLDEVTDVARRYIHRCDTSAIPASSVWRQPQADVPSELADIPNLTESVPVAPEEAEVSS
jgi:UDP-sulfoquinovose synthase